MTISFCLERMMGANSEGFSGFVNGIFFCRKWKLFAFLLVFVHLHISSGDPGPCALLDTGSTSVCISLEEINRAFHKARLAFNLLEPVKFSPHKVQFHHHDIDQLGHVLVETSRILAKEFKLDYEQIYEFLPHLDLEFTDIWKFCPKVFKAKKCKVSKYRTLSGHCNNINHPDWGAAITPFRYVLHPDRPDGLAEPREYGKDDAPLPPPRLVSAKVHRDKVFHDHAVTIMLIAWGQIIDHDITFTAETKDFSSGKDPECCNDNIYDVKPKERHRNCYPIRIPHDDSFYSYYQHHCMNFARSFAGVRAGCRLGPRVAFNGISSFLDANFVYGSNTEIGTKLRTGEYGLLKTLPLFKEHHLKDLLPLKTDDPDDGCIRPNSDIFCFFAGDNRVNEQLVLTTLHTIFMREHNAIALTLSKINPHWDDEKLYQETRKIIIAIVQHITFNEFLPMILGKDLVHEYGLSVEDGYWTGYDPHTNPGALEEFITSAFRFGHSLLPEKIERWSTSHHFIDATKLHEMLRQPFNMFRPGYADSFIMGLVNQLAQVMDEGVTDQVTTLLFKEQGKSFGMDLASMNIQRGRDHGVPPYAAYRKKCGLPPIHHWDDLIGVMRNETVYKYKHLYREGPFDPKRSPWDIDLWSGGVSEIPKPGSMIGPTFGCIIAMQFKALRYGDRFWYELPDLPSSFTIEQLNEIKGMKLSRLLCDNGDDIKTIQLYAMVHPDHQINPRVSCYSKILPTLDLNKWSDTRDSRDLKDSKGDQSVIHKAHLYTDLETLKPPLYDETFIKLKEKQGEIDDDHPDKHSNSTKKPFSYEELIPAFRKIPGDVPIIENGIDDPPPPTKGPYDGGTLHDVFPPTEYGSGPGSPYRGYPAGPPPPSGPHRPRSKPSVLNIVKNRSILGKILTNFSRKRRRPNRLPRVPPYPPSPFPGMGGLYSPNPGYLVRRNYHVHIGR